MQKFDFYLHLCTYNSNNYEKWIKILQFIIQNANKATLHVNTIYTNNTKINFRLSKILRREGRGLIQITGNTKLYSILDSQSIHKPQIRHWEKTGIHSSPQQALKLDSFLLVDFWALKKVQSSVGAGSQRKHKRKTSFPQS